MPIRMQDVHRGSKRKRIVVILIILLVLGIAVYGGIIYLNKVFLPVKAKALIVQRVEKAINKKITLQSLQFSLLKGLVLENLVVYDGEQAIISLKQGSCTLLIWPLFRKQIIIPAVNLNSPVVFLERRPDNTFNLLDLLPRKEDKPSKKGFGLFIHTLNIRDAHIDFRDNTLPVAFNKSMDNLNLSASLSLPASIKFKLESIIPATPDIRIKASGNYKIPEKELKAGISVKDLSPGEFLAYYRNSGILIPEGLIDAMIDLKLKGDILYVDLKTQNKNVNISGDKIQATVNSQVEASLEYSLKDKQLRYSGNTNIDRMDIWGLNFIERLDDIAGRIEFNQNQLKWIGLNFKCKDVLYKTEGELVNFSAPVIKMELSFGDILLQSNFAIINKLINIIRLSGRYLNSEFSARGNVDVRDISNLRTNISTELNINLTDIKGALKTFQKQIEQIKPGGKLHVNLNLNGNIRDIKSCKIEAELSSPSISAYGLNSQEFRLLYNQENGLADIPLMRLSLYGGGIQAKANMNLKDDGIPYRANANIREVKIEKLKLDTPAKDRDVAGTIQAQIEINGLWQDLASTLRGAGNIMVTKGKLWQLNLFKGIGELIFARDYANVVFSEGYCDFSVQDKTVFTDNLQLKSNLIDLSGPVRIGFDNSIEASINVNIIGETAPDTGTFKDVISGIIGQAGRFGVVKISGTLKKPNYKFDVAVIDILKKLKDSIFKIPPQ